MLAQEPLIVSPDQVRDLPPDHPLTRTVLPSLKGLHLPLPNGGNGNGAVKGNGNGVGADKMQQARFELKYIVSREEADRLRDIVRVYLLPDEFTRGKEGYGYFVHSLYLDSLDLKTYEETEQGSRNRFKLRIRFYDDNPDSPCFLEVKRRECDRILKTRAMVSKAAAERFCRTGVLPGPEDLLKPSPSHMKGLLNFNRLATLIDARPAAYTSYRREGYEGEFDNRERITFDHDRRGAPFTGRLSIAGREHWKQPRVGGIVFEMKYTDDPPPWMPVIARLRNLERTACKKYILCLEETRPELKR